MFGVGNQKLVHSVRATPRVWQEMNRPFNPIIGFSAGKAEETSAGSSKALAAQTGDTKLVIRRFK
jgi:hypothetical protein